MDRLSEIGGITKDQAATLTAEASLGGGFGKVVRVGASGRASWRGQTMEREAWNRMQDYAEQHQVTDLWSQVSEASRRYSSATGESELASLDESFGANLTRMQRYEDRASASFQTAENWSAQASQVRSEAQSIDRELGQPFFAWLSERPGGDGRPIGVGGALRLATPQTPEEAETLREYAAEFVSERLPSPASPGVASVPSRATFEDAREDLRDTQVPATGAAYGELVGRRAGAGGGGPRAGGCGTTRGRIPGRDRVGNGRAGRRSAGPHGCGGSGGRMTAARRWKPNEASPWASRCWKKCRWSEAGWPGGSTGPRATTPRTGRAGGGTSTSSIAGQRLKDGVLRGAMRYAGLARDRDAGRKPVVFAHERLVVGLIPTLAHALRVAARSRGA